MTLKDVAKIANNMLLAGFGHENEPDFEGKRSIETGFRGTVMDKVSKYINRRIAGLANIEPMLINVPCTRASWYRRQHHSNKARDANKNADVRGYRVAD